MTTCPKPFIGEFVDIQSNAIDSWKALNQVHPNVKVHIHLIGDEENIAKACEIHKVYHIASVKRNEYNTPLVSDLIKITQSLTTNNPNTEKVYCFINCDIVLLPDFINTIYAFTIGKLNNLFGTSNRQGGVHHQGVQSVHKDYLIVGQRIDIDRLPRIFNFNDLNSTYNDLLNRVKNNGKIHSPDGMDYFIFSKGTFPFVYDFAIGKLVWDAWLTGNAYRRGLMTIDATKTITAVHQDGPWYQASNIDTNTKGFTKTREKLEESREVLINQSFDYYEKNSKTGTTWKIEFDETAKVFRFIKKDYVPE